MDEEGLKVDEGTTRKWAAIALQIRTLDVVVQSVTEPVLGSPFAVVDGIYPSEASSQWAREPLSSAADHLTTWANHAVPLDQHEGQIVMHYGFRWTFTLIRAALEGAVQSMWLTQAKSNHECVARLIRSVRHDIHEEMKAWEALGRDTTELVSRGSAHAERAEQWAEWGKPAQTLPSMVDLIRKGAIVEGLEPRALEATWRVCSAAAHGKDWAIRELQVFSKGHEWRPGQYHVVGHLDPEKLTRMLEETTDLLNRAMIHFLSRMGVDINREIRRAIIVSAERTPSTDGGALVGAMRDAFNRESASTA